ncbi:MAG: hypothetical protein Kow00121_28450 [Elainellaceae cyanobacterium]
MFFREGITTLGDGERKELRNYEAHWYWCSSNDFEWSIARPTQNHYNLGLPLVCLYIAVEGLVRTKVVWELAQSAGSHTTPGSTAEAVAI